MSIFYSEGGGKQALSDADLTNLRAAGRSSTDEDGRELVQIDDMVFLAADVRRSGFSGRRWTDGRVYYAYDANVTDANKARFSAACAVWSEVADLEFVVRTSTQRQNYIHVQSDGDENSSAVGMIGGRQVMKIHNWSRKFIIAHEIGHALGLSHEQSRSDRDTYVEIMFNNIISGKEHNFEKDTTTIYNTYDFASIMHYGQYAFSKNNQTTIEARPGYEDQEQYMGNRQYLTALDAAGMAAHYGPRRAVTRLIGSR